MVAAATVSMATLNRAAAEAGLRHGATAATDVTGFGLAGHAAGIARESAVTLEIALAALAVLPGALDLALRFQPGGLKSNRKQFEPLLEFAGDPGEARRALVYDPQTSGGLLLALAEPAAARLVDELPGAVRIGRVVERGPRALVFR